MGKLMKGLDKFCSETSLHGLCHISGDNPRTINVLWALTFLIALGSSLVGIFKVCVLYHSKPMSTDYRIVANNTMELPSLTICAMSHLSKSKLRQMGVSPELEQVMYYALGFELYRPELLSVKNAMLWHEYEVLLQRHNLSDFEELLMKLSLPCESMVGELGGPGNCTIGDRDLNCCKQGKQFLFPAKCITIAASGFMPPKQSYQYIVNLNWPRLDEQFIPSNIAARSRDYTLVMNKGNRGVLGAKEIGRARPGRMYNIKVWMRMYESVNNPPRYSCVDELPFPGYDTDECMEDCTLSAIFAGQGQCECTPAGAFKARPIKSLIHNFTNWKPLCDPWQLQRCHIFMMEEQERSANELSERLMRMSREEQEQHLMDLKEGDNTHERCRLKCPMTCNKIVWNAHMLETVRDPQILEDYYLHSSQNNISLTDIRKYELNSSRVFLTFSQMEYTYTKQQLAMTAETILSYLGGQLGLFLGGSLLTFAHFVLFLCYSMFSSVAGMSSHSSTPADTKKASAKEEHLQQQQQRNGTPSKRRGSTAVGGQQQQQQQQNTIQFSPTYFHQPPLPDIHHPPPPHPKEEGDSEEEGMQKQQFAVNPPCVCTCQCYRRHIINNNAVYNRNINKNVNNNNNNNNHSNHYNNAPIPTFQYPMMNT